METEGSHAKNKNGRTIMMNIFIMEKAFIYALSKRQQMNDVIGNTKPWLSNKASEMNARSGRSSGGKSYYKSLMKKYRRLAG